MKYPTSVLLVAIIGINGCSHPHDHVVVANKNNAPNHIPASGYRYVEDGTPYTLSDFEWAMYRHAAQSLNQTDLARSSNASAESEIDTALTGRKIRVTGRVENIKRIGNEIVVEMTYELNGERRIPKKLRPALYSLTFTDKQSTARRVWQIQIYLNADQYDPETMSDWPIGALIALDGKVTSAQGFELEKSNDGKIRFTSNEQSLRIEPISKIVRGDVAKYDSVVILLDVSGSMSEHFHEARRLTERILRRLGPTQKFNLYAFSDDLQLRTYSPGLVEVNTAQIDHALSYLIKLVPEGKTRISPTLKHVIEQQPSAIFVISDFDFEADFINVLPPPEAANQPEIHFIHFYRPYDHSQKQLVTHPSIKSMAWLGFGNEEPINQGLFAAAFTPYLVGNKAFDNLPF